MCNRNTVLERVDRIIGIYEVINLLRSEGHDKAVETVKSLLDLYESQNLKIIALMLKVGLNDKK